MQLLKHLPEDGAAFVSFGWSVAIGSGLVVVGNWADDDNGVDSGSVYLLVEACNVADFDQPNGVLDLADILAFLIAFLDGDAAADLAAPLGLFDQADINAFIDACVAGCP